MDADHERKALIKQLRQRADPKRAAGEKAYLKSPQQFHGVNMPGLRTISKAWHKSHKNEPIAAIAQVSAILWDSDWHEERSLAILILEHRQKDLTRQQMPLIEKMIHEAVGWAHLDAIATGLVGALIDTDPTVLDELPRWAKSENFWVRRAAVLAQIRQFRRGEGDFDLFTRIAAPMLNEGKDWSKEERFFIRKAIGWTLRELAPRQPGWVVNFVQHYRLDMAGLTYREATRKLPAEYRQQLSEGAN